MGALPLSTHRDGKHPITVLAGPYGHPVHPILITIPIGAWLSSFVFDIISRVTEDETYYKGAYVLIGIGIAGAVLAAFFGLLDLLTLPTGTRVFQIAIAHMILNLFAVALFAVDFGLRMGLYSDFSATPPGLIVLSAGALLLLSLSGYLGGKMVFHYGVRVTRETSQADGFQKTAHRPVPTSHPVALGA